MFRQNIFQSILKIVSVLALFTLSYSLHAQAGCCSHHGGVSGCDSATNHQLCKDGTDSPSCLCSGGKATQSKSTAPTSAPAPKSNTYKSSPMPASTKGCCSRHGGVASCNKSTGFQMCKDGSQSTTCKCN